MTPPRNEIKVFSTFSGVGGFELGLPKNSEIVGFSEIDKYASQVLKYHYPNVKNYGNVCDIDWKQAPDFDLLTGGSPCQDFSIAGKRRGLAGAKSSLAWEFIRGLRSKKPRYFIWENVKGVMSSRGGWDFANLLIAFSESGYALWWQVLNAKDFGVPQNRERIFVFGTRKGNPKEVFFESKDTRQIEINRTIRAGGRGSTDDKHSWDILAVRRSGDRGKQKTSLSETMGALSANPMSDSIPIVISSTQKHATITEDISSALPSAMGLGGGHIPMVNAVRKLMPKECERLMSWPDDWTRWGVNEKGEKVEISDSQRYKMCGNGVVSNVVRELRKHLFSK